jgi:uncharacterized protein (DUF1778 family)
MCSARMRQLRPRGAAVCGTATDGVRAVLTARQLMEFESMRRPNLSLRLQRSLMEEARKAAASEGVSLNQLINVAVAEKVSALRTELYVHERIRRADHEETLRILDRALKGNPRLEGDEILKGGLQGFGKKPQPKVQPAPVIGGLPFAAQGKQVQPAPPPDREGAGETGNPAERATPQFGKLKRRLEKARGR